MRGGFTWIEVLVACSITVILMLVVGSLVPLSLDSYNSVTDHSRETENGRTALDLLSRDLERIALDYPVTWGEGVSGNGMAFVKGGACAWDAGFGVNCPEETGRPLPNDRLGFFLITPASQEVNGMTLAHVLYFTALTKNSGGEELLPANSDTERGYGRKLYRLYTPPDRVFARLKELDPSRGVGDGAIPKGPNYLGASVFADDLGWVDPEVSPAVLSLVADNVAQFSVALAGRYESGGVVSYLKGMSEGGPSEGRYASSIHAMLMGEELDFAFSLNSLELGLKACPSAYGSTRTVDQWESMENNEGEVSFPHYNFSYSFKR